MAIDAVIDLFSGPYFIYLDVDQTLRFSPGSIGRYLTQISMPDHYMRWYLSNLKGKLNRAVPVSVADHNKCIARLKPGKAASSVDKPKVQYNFGSKH